MDLSLQGPERLILEGGPDVPRPAKLTFGELFDAMIETHDPSDPKDLASFANWISDAAMGEDPGLEEVRLGYEVEHAMAYMDSGDPLLIAKAGLIKFRGRASPISDLLGDVCCPCLDHERTA